MAAVTEGNAKEEKGTYALCIDLRDPHLGNEDKVK
jgi:hypothetical protein